jgi:hypothetical protein
MGPLQRRDIPNYWSFIHTRMSNLRLGSLYLLPCNLTVVYEGTTASFPLFRSTLKGIVSNQPFLELSEQRHLSKRSYLEWVLVSIPYSTIERLENHCSGTAYMHKVLSRAWAPSEVKYGLPWIRQQRCIPCWSPNLRRISLWSRYITTCLPT